MQSLPIFDTVSRTFGFVVERRFFSLLRLIWLPVFLSVAVGMLPLVYQIEMVGLEPNPAKEALLLRDPAYWALEAVNIVMSLLLGAMIAVSVHRMILLDDRQPGAFFYWRLTREEWLYILAWIGYFILVCLALALPIAAHFYYVASFESVGQAVAVLSSMAEGDPAKNVEGMRKLFGDPRLFIALGLGIVFALVALARFGLVFPIIVAEGRLSFWRSWVVTRGNTLQLIGFWIVTVILTYVVIILIVAVAAAAVAGIFLSTALGGQAGSALGIALLAVPAAISLAMYLVIGVTLFIAAMSFSYRALASEEQG
jgi:hypothetical protein